MKPTFEVLRLDYDKENRRRVDSAIRDALGLPGVPCGEVWAAIKALPDDERERLTERVADRL